MPLNRFQLFLWGCLGAALPELLRFFHLAAAGQPLPALNWLLYSVVFAFFVLAAGAFTLAWEADSPFKAIWVGASCPTIITALITTAPTHL